MQKRWNLRLLGGFELRNPEGMIVALPTRKVQRLLAMLVLCPGRSSTRHELQRELWGDTAAERQQTSLRQALAQLRRAIGDDAIVATRDRCQLSASFVLDCDAVELERSLASPDTPPPECQPEEFLPDAFEPWFERRRHRYLAAFTDGAPKAILTAQLPLQGLLSMMRWYAETEAPKALFLLRDHLDLVHGIPPCDLHPVIEKTILGSPVDHPLLGWAFLWRGHCVMNSREVSVGEVFLRRAMMLAETHNDSALLVEAGVLLTAGQIVGGRALAAEKTVLKVRDVVEKSNSKLLTSRWQSMAGTFLIHQGQVEKGLRLMEQAQDGVSSSATESAQLEVLRALFTATSGQTELAAKMLDAPEKFGYVTGHWSLTEISLLTRAIIAVKEHEAELAAKLLEDLIVRASSTLDTHMEVYAREALALVAWRQKEKSITAAQLKGSGKLRRNLGMGMTDWDRSRLGELFAIE